MMVPRRSTLGIFTRIKRGHPQRRGSSYQRPEGGGFDEQCNCSPAADNCPAGPPGPPGQAGAPGDAGLPGQVQNHNIIKMLQK